MPRSENEKVIPPEETAPKPKKFFKSRNTDTPDSSQNYKTIDMTYGSVTKKLKIVNESPEKTTKTASRKFFASKNEKIDSPEKTVLSSNVNIVSRNETKPPIVLRICRGKSQLVNDSDESESTPTPSSTPSTSNATSPRALRDTVQRSPSCRITRSARRSMQQDPDSSPATADTPSEFSLFTSPKQELDLSPQYIPAERYELERKAMYDNLLKPSSPVPSITENLENTAKEGDDSLENDVFDKPFDNYDTLSIDLPPENLHREHVIGEKDEAGKNEKDEAEGEEQEQEQQQQSELLDNTEEIVTTKSTVVEDQVTKGSIEEEWDTDSDSNSTAPESETKIAETINSDNHHSNDEPKMENDVEDNEEQESTPPVKLLIMKKKGSIFKSRALVNDGQKKRRALYRHKWSDDKEAAQKGDPSTTTENSIVSSMLDEFGFNDDPLTRVTMPKAGSDDDSDEVTSIKCTKGDKGVSFLI